MTELNCSVGIAENFIANGKRNTGRSGNEIKLPQGPDYNNACVIKQFLLFSTHTAYLLNGRTRPRALPK